MISGEVQRAGKTKRYRQETGQASVLVVLMLSLFLLGVLAFAVDYTNIWFQRQQAQTAADAACEAGAMDIFAIASGETMPNMGFSLGTAGNCNAYSSSGPTMCWYASKNGFNGYTGGAATVSWTFPGSVSGVTAPPSSIAPYPFLQISVSLPVKTYFSTLLTGNQTQQVAAKSTCGLTQIMQGAPIMVLHPTISGALTYSGGASLTIVGGPPRSIVVNSSNATAVLCDSSGVIDTAEGGPNLTGSDVGTYGGPHVAPGSATGCYGTNGNTGLPAGFDGGTTGHWDWPASPVPDPYAAVPAAAGMKSYTPGTKRSDSGSNVTYYNLAAPEMDGCPDTAPTDYGSYNDNTYWTCNLALYGTKSWYCRGCHEYAPGYYPSGISENGNDVITFLPGVYYMDGNLAIGGSDTIRMAKACANSQGVVNTNSTTGNCSPYTQTAGPNGGGGGTPWTWHQTDGVMFYFHGTAVPIISGASGAPVSPRVDEVPVTDLTCNGSTPPSYLDLPSALNTNIMLAECTTLGTYYDLAGDTTDSLGTIRGLLMFMDHADTGSPQLQGSGTLAYTGTLYFHSTSYATIFQIPGGTTTGTLIWGNVVTDQMQLTGSGALMMALNPSATTPILKVGLLQ
ncbi:MAG: pilus assembly protein TadG-related protein [Candidatus Korobacteraceae bacterium]|jgi:putative Flp pilus-assembly TadE/G-like protein